MGIFEPCIFRHSHSHGNHPHSHSHGNVFFIPIPTGNPIPMHSYNTLHTFSATTSHLHTV